MGVLILAVESFCCLKMNPVGFSVKLFSNACCASENF